MEHVQTGCCGFPATKLKYAARFQVVEVQQTFYQPPQIKTLELWRVQLPAPFEFTLKAWQLITHTAKSPTFRRLRVKLTPEELAQCGSFQTTATVRHAWETTRACAVALGARLVLFQCPASFTPVPPNLVQMRQFFSSIDRGGLKFLWEPRGPWPDSLVRSLCQELDLVHAVDPFVSRSVTPDFIYFRLHGGKGFKHVFTDEELQTLAGLVRGHPSACVMFNNLKMWDDAERFQHLISESSG